MLVVNTWCGHLVSSQARRGAKLDLHSKLSNVFLGKLFIDVCDDMSDVLASLQDQAAKLMKHAWCCPTNVVLFVGDIRITPPGFDSIRRLTTKQARIASCVLHAARVTMLWDETDSACYTSDKRNNHFDVFGFLERQAKRAMLEQSYVDLASIPHEGRDRIGEDRNAWCVAAKSDLLAARHHLSCVRFSQACALWGVQADFPDGTSCRFDIFDPLNVRYNSVVLGYFHDGLAVLKSVLLNSLVFNCSLSYDASKPARLLWLVPGPNLQSWLDTNKTMLFTPPQVGVDALAYDSGFVLKFKA
jgi:hypothetical protein